MKKTMNVMVYPDIWCSNDGTRWWLEEPRKGVAWATEAERRPLEARVPFTQLVEPEKPTIPGGLWKRVDDYFIVDDPEDRYDPSKIKGYRLEKDVSVDEHELGKGSDGKKVYCGPNNENPLPGGSDQTCKDAFPLYRTERIDLIELDPADPGRAGQELISPTSTIGAKK